MVEGNEVSGSDGDKKATLREKDACHFHRNHFPEVGNAIVIIELHTLACDFFRNNSKLGLDGVFYVFWNICDFVRALDYGCTNAQIILPIFPSDISGYGASLGDEQSYAYQIRLQRCFR